MPGQNNIWIVSAHFICIPLSKMEWLKQAADLTHCCARCFPPIPCASAVSEMELPRRLSPSLDGTSCLLQRPQGHPQVQALLSTEDAEKAYLGFSWSNFHGSNPVIWGGQEDAEEQVVLTVLISLALFFSSTQTCSTLPAHLHFPLKL